MRIKTRISGMPCTVRVTHYSPGVPMRTTGSGFGDADPPEDEEFEFEVYDRGGYRAPWLERKVTEEDEIDLLRIYKERRDDY